ncbi:MAG: EAL domain-containing protein [Saprospiraceae bacterium]|nr:EAL domain-containing protein [Pyrinomonadaceae bacterium]
MLTNSHLTIHSIEVFERKSDEDLSAEGGVVDPANKKRPTVLIVDDELPIRNLLCDLLSEEYECSSAESAEEAISKISRGRFDVIVSDINLGGMTGVEMIPHVSEIDPDAVVLMISGDQTIDTAIESMRVGAFDYIKKPFDFDKVLLSVRRATEQHLLLADKRQHEKHMEQVITERTARLNYLAYHDELTHLPNRALFEDRFRQANLQTSENQITATILLSIDRFNTIRDTLGYSSGNQLLIEFADRLETCAGNAATVARFDGDEFAVLLPQAVMRDVLEIAVCILRDLKAPFLVEGQEIFVTPSMGISVFRDDGNDVQTLLKNAGAALSRVREEGGNNYKFYVSEMNIKAVKRLSLESDLRRAVERSEFDVYYQPKIDTRTNKIIGIEALLRWNHPTLGLVAPNDFIPTAEETGLIVPIGEWVLRAACVQTKLWHDEGFPLSVAVNLSAVQFQEDDLAGSIAGIVAETGLDPHYLNLEVTETSIMENSGSAFKTLNSLRELGVLVSIDDFGTGYSSLGYLKSLPIDVLKIDRTFICDLTTSPDDAAMVTAILTLAHNLKLNVVAEGVETEEQLELLQTLECDEWQGYLCSKPVPADILKQLLVESGKAAGVLSS